MVDQDNQPHDQLGDSQPPENAEAQVFAAIVRYLAEQLGEVDPDAEPSDLVHTADLFSDIAEAFEATGGFEYPHEQALPLSHAFAMIEGGMRILSEQAHESGHTNAAAKMEWAAVKARAMTAKLEESHLGSVGGIIAFGRDEDADEV